jgi:hypothetical protein
MCVGSSDLKTHFTLDPSLGQPEGLLLLSLEFQYRWVEKAERLPFLLMKMKVNEVLTGNGILYFLSMEKGSASFLASCTNFSWRRSLDAVSGR